MPNVPPKPRHQIIHSECLSFLRKLQPDRLDAMISDPPSGIGFMQKSWDGDKGGRDQWIGWLQEIMTEALRVLKPGAHALVWALPRTQHWTATALENAGFEIRDSIVYLFGSGFPKSLSLSKAIDRAAGATREVIGTQTLQGTAALSTKEKGGTYKSGGPPAIGRSVEIEITAPATEEAKQWDGWGTALKPSHECWILVRKPIEKKSIAEQVLATGTGAINVDACRVGTGEDKTPAPTKRGNSRPAFTTKSETNLGGNDAIGRFPADTIISEQVAAELGAKGAYFYSPKASKADRNFGLPAGQSNTHSTVKSTQLMRYLCRLITPPNGVILDPFCGSGSTGVAAIQEGFGFLGIEENQEYVAIANSRIDGVLNLKAE